MTPSQGSAPSRGTAGPERCPPGWPDGVRPPGTADWRRSATAWLLDQCPPEYRGHRVLTRHLAALVWLAERQVEAQVEAGHQALAQVRSGLAEAMDAEALAELVDVLQAEQVRLIAVQRGIRLVEQAAQGKHYVPRL